MYEIHINASTIHLTKSAYIKGMESGNEVLITKYNGKTKSLLNYIDKSEKSKERKVIYIHAEEVLPLKEAFFGLFKIIKAAGGLVLNNRGQVLMIFRRGSWDLPKGKKEGKERRKQTAVREVIEETGLKTVQILRNLPDTYHTYRMSGRRILKVSHWYLMETTSEKLLPQYEEDIEKAEWVDIGEIKSGNLKPIYPNIEYLLQYYVSTLSA